MSLIDQKKIFAKNLNYFLTLNKKTQKEVADNLGIGISTFNSWCLGDKMPRMDKVQILADYFNIGKSDLLDDKTKEQRGSHYISEETKEIALIISEKPELRLLFESAKDADPDDINVVYTMLLALRGKGK